MVYYRETPELQKQNQNRLKSVKNIDYPQRNRQ